MKTIFLVLFFISLGFWSIAGQTYTQCTHQKISNNSIVPIDTIYYKTFKTRQGWGYDIFVNGKLYVHQSNIPAVSGNKSFVTEEYAAKTAQLVIDKIKNHLLPPTISIKELDSIKVLK
jgi:hypothetical protein